MGWFENRVKMLFRVQILDCFIFHLSRCSCLDTVCHWASNIVANLHGKWEHFASPLPSQPGCRPHPQGIHEAKMRRKVEVRFLCVHSYSHSNSYLSIFFSIRYFEATSWLLTTATDSICPMVTIFYWLHLIQQEQDDESQDYQPKLGQNLAYRKTYDQLFFHTVNFFVVTLDLMVSAKPVRLCHMIYPCLVVLGYLGCSQIYWQFSGGNALTFGVIPMLNGENPSILLLIFLEGL